MGKAHPTFCSTRIMRICLYTGSALPKLGGQEAVVDSLARQFQQLGHDVTVIAPRPRLPLWPRDRELPYRVLRHPRFYSTARGVGLYRVFLARAFRKFQFEVVHCHDVYPTGYVASLALDQTPLVLTSHGGDIRPGNARLAKPGLRSRFVDAISSAAAMISIGNFTRDAFLQLGADAAKIHDIPNGVDLAPFQSPVDRPDGFDSAIRSNSYVLFLGRLSDRKGVDTLIRAIAADRAGTTRLSWVVIAGSGDQRAELHSLAKSLNVADRVRFVGRVTGPAKIWLLQNAIATAMPSRGWEAFPLTVLESYAAGRPVIGSNIPGMVDVIRPEETGLLVEPDSVEAWAAAIGRVQTDADWVESAGGNARAMAADFGWESIARRHIELYESIRT
jgi:glycosyltransferase involved in cell wall biosynthesis